MPSQPNKYDCGIFVIFFAARILRDPAGVRFILRHQYGISPKQYTDNMRGALSVDYGRLSDILAIRTNLKLAIWESLQPRTEMKTDDDDDEVEFTDGPVRGQVAPEVIELPDSDDEGDDSRGKAKSNPIVVD